MLKYSLILLSLILFLSCKHNRPQLHLYQPSNDLIKYTGRYEVLPENSVALIGSAAAIQFSVKGDSVHLYLQTESNARNYYVVTINDAYKGRFKIEGDTIQKIALDLDDDVNEIEIYKATEAFNDKIIFHGVDAEVLLPVEEKKFKIEFIGNSITCGALADDSEIACNEGDYQDQHNAYLAYGPRVARRLNADVVLSSVSGIGMYRNWNDENLEEPTMPQVYDNLYLNLNNTKPFDLKVEPHIVSICLGTNDMSDGDGIKERSAFNLETYINTYIQFVDRIFRRYPNTKIALLSSPMIAGEKQHTLFKGLKQVQSHFKETLNKDIELFKFEKIYANGCNYHPSIADHKAMADVLEPFFKSLLLEEN